MMIAFQVPGLPQAQDTSQLPDSLPSSFDRIGEQVTATGRLILEGEWSLVWARSIEGLTNLAIGLVPNVLSALFVGVIFYGLYRLLISVSGSVLHRSHAVDEGLETISMRTLRVVGWSFILVLVLSQLGINVAALIAGLGIAGLALGFAAKDSLENFIAGVTILLDRPFSVGDWVTVAAHYGKVEHITLRSTRIRTPNNQTVVFPSVQMVTQAVVNHTSGAPLRVDVPFGIAYKESVDEARDVVMGLVDREDERLAPGADHKVVVTELGDSSVNMQLRLFLLDPGYAVAVRCDYVEAIFKALKEAGIEIPFPHLQLFIDEAKALRDTPVRVLGGDGA